MYLCVQSSFAEQQIGKTETLKLQKQTRGLMEQPLASLARGMQLSCTEESGLCSDSGSSQNNFRPNLQPCLAVRPESDLVSEPSPIPDDVEENIGASSSSLGRTVPSAKVSKTGAPPPAPPKDLLKAVKRGTKEIKRVPQV